jgi:hypothetical protein
MLPDVDDTPLRLGFSNFGFQAVTLVQSSVFSE